MTDAAPTPVAELSYEQARDELVRVVTELEQGSRPSSSRSPSGSAARRSPAAARSGWSARRRAWTPPAPRRERGPRTREPAAAPTSTAARSSPNSGAPRRRKRPPTARRLEREAHRSNQTVLNLVIALVASLGIVVFLLVVVVRPDSRTAASRRLRVRRGRGAAHRGRRPWSCPQLPAGWTANRAELRRRQSPTASRPGRSDSSPRRLSTSAWPRGSRRMPAGSPPSCSGVRPTGDAAVRRARVDRSTTSGPRRTRATSPTRWSPRPADRTYRAVRHRARTPSSQTLARVHRRGGGTT